MYRGFRKTFYEYAPSFTFIFLLHKAFSEIIDTYSIYNIQKYQGMSNMDRKCATSTYYYQEIKKSRFFHYQSNENQWKNLLQFCSYTVYQCCSTHMCKLTITFVCLYFN